MRWVAAGVLAVVVGLGVVLALGDPGPADTGSRLEGRPLPALDLERLDGGRLTSADLEGRTVVVNFWNSWCIPCRREHPELVAFFAAHRDDPDLVMVGIVRDDTEAAVREYVEEEGVDWLVALDPKGRAALDFGTTGQPETYVAGPDGIVRGVVLGPTTADDLEALVARARDVS